MSKKIWVFTCVLILAGIFVFSACAPKAEPLPEPGSAPEEGSAGIANPASENCVKQGGELKIEQRGDLGEIGVCYFEDNMQCEEWAMMYGDCPVGGIRVTGYVTEAARFCAITGGDYSVTDENGEVEQGACTFKSGKSCDVWDYYNGKCDKE